MEGDEEITGPINLGNPTEFSIKELAEKVVNLIDNGSNIVYEPLPQDDPTQRQPNIAQAKEVLGWEPKIPLDEGLPKTIDFFRGLK